VTSATAVGSANPPAVPGQKTSSQMLERPIHSRSTGPLVAHGSRYTYCLIIDGPAVLVCLQGSEKRLDSGNFLTCAGLTPPFNF
jgi:hypothetical protein